MPEEPSPRIALVIVVQADYKNWNPQIKKGWEPLTKVQQAARDLAEALGGRRYVLQLPKLLNGGTRTEVVSALDDWLRGLSDKDRLLLYWTGHGTGNGTHYLVTKESPRSGISVANALPARDLANLIAQSKAEKVLVVLDTCYSAMGAQSIAEEVYKILNGKTDLPGQSRYAAVIPSAVLNAQEAVLSRVLLKVLTEPNPPKRTWTDRDDYIRVSALMAELVGALRAELGDDWQPPRPFTLGWDDRFLPNPLYRPNQPAMDVETRRFLRVPPALDRAARGIEGAESGWYFIGRTRVLTELSTWLKDGTGLVVLTGPPGAGKSAVLGRVVILSDPEVLRNPETAEALYGVPKEAIPPEGQIAAAVHVKGLTAGECAGQIASQLGLKLPPGTATFDPRTLLERTAQEGLTPTVVLDALDESKEPMWIGMMLRGLVEGAGARVLVGTRRSPEGGVIAKDEDRHARLRTLFGQEALILDLEDEADTEADIASYVKARLLDDPRSHHRDADPSVSLVAQAVAEKADGVFLYARVVARTLQEAPTLDAPLPASVLEAFVADLTARFGDDRGRVEDLLAALAWAEGGGLSRAVWPAAATAVPPETRAATDADVAWVLKHAGFHILEAGQSGQTVYRLAHQSFAEHYRSLVGDPRAAQRAIAVALAGDTAGAGWLDADAYVLRHLADHAATGRVLGRFVTDPGYLAAAHPARLLAALGSLSAEEPEARRIGAIYRWAADRLFDADPVERMAILHLTAHQEDPGLASGLEPLLTPRWRTRWARCQPSAHHQVIGRHRKAVTSVALGVIDGKSVIVSGGADGTVRLWDARSGVPRGQPLTGHGASVNSVALGVIDGKPVVVSGGDDGMVRLWDARSGVPRGEPLTGRGSVNSVTLGVIDGKPVIVSGEDDGMVRLWDARSGVPRREPLPGPVMAVNSVAFGVIDGEPVVISGGHDERVRLWDARSGVPRGEPLTGHGRSVNSVALGVIDGKPVIVSGGADGTVRLWDARSGVPRGEPLTGHGGWVSSVALGIIDGKPVVVSGGGADRTVRLWNAHSGLPLGEPLTGHGRSVNSVALGLIDGKPAVISGGSDGTVRLWDARSGVPRGEPPRGWVNAEALGIIDGEPMVVSRGGDWTVRLWDARSGVPRGEPLTGTGQRDLVASMALGVIDGKPAIVSGGSDGTVRLWDARSGVPRGVTSHGMWVTSVALGVIDGKPAIVSGGIDGTVRLWDARSGAPRGEPLTGHARRVDSVALGVIDGEPVIVSGGIDGTVRLWDARSGAPWGEPLTHGDSVTSVALGVIDGEPVVVSGGMDGTVRLWDARGNGPTTTIRLGSMVNHIIPFPPSGLAVALAHGLVVIDVPPPPPALRVAA